MFTRGEGPLVSVLLASRGRPKWLVETVESMHNLAKDPKLIEYLFRIDEDDKETIKTALELSERFTCRTLVAPRGRGYFDLHISMGDLGAIAKGDWLFVFNDDARMKTEGWDQVLLNVKPSEVPGWEGCDDICLFAPRVIEREISWEFPILRRKVLQILGHFSNHNSNDSYIYWVMSGIRAAIFLTKIEVTHFVNEIEDQTKKEGRVVIDKTMNDLYSDEMQTKIKADKEILRKYIKEFCGRKEG